MSLPPLFLCRSSLCLPQNPRRKWIRSVRFDPQVVEVCEVSEMEDRHLAVDTCITRALPLALTLEQWIERIRQAVDDSKLNYPSTSRGFLILGRFERFAYFVDKSMLFETFISLSFELRK